MRWIVTIVWLTIAANTAFAADDPPFPRLAALWWSNQNYEDPRIQQQLARGEIALINFWPGWEFGRGTTIEQVVRNIKAINPRTKVFGYMMNAEVAGDRTAVQPLAELYTKLDASRWYLYSSGTNGSIVDSFWAGAITVNNTLFTPRDSNGDRWVEWYAKWAVKNLYTPNPSLDGFVLDNTFWRPRVNGDFNLDGVTDSRSDPVVGVWQRQGLRRHFEMMRQLMPGKYQLGNTADWGAGDAVLTDLDQQLNGGFMEGLIGFDWSAETWGGWSEMMRFYRKILAAYAEPKLGVFHYVGSPTDYQGFRYGFGSCLLDNGYFVFSSSVAYNDVPLFDEYGAKLGSATSSPPTSAWQSGVYRRDFENGIVLVNPKGNGAKTVQLEADFRRISGTQVPAVNNGQVTRTVTLNDRDGIVLMRLNAVRRPASPVLSVQ